MRLQTALRMTLLLWIGSLFALLGMQRFVLDPLDSLLATCGRIHRSGRAAVARDAAGAAHRTRVVRCGSASTLLLYLCTASGNGRRRSLFGMLEVIFALGAFITAWILLKVMPKDAGKALTATP